MDYAFLSGTALFQGTPASEIAGMLSCLGATTRSYQKDELVYHMGDVIERMGLVLSGGLHVVQNDVWGNQNILDLAAPGQAFAEAYAFAPGEALMVNVIAAAPSEVLFLDASRVTRTCPSSCERHDQLLRNLLNVMARKNLRLTRKLSHITPKFTRERLLSYLSSQALKQGTHAFDIPFNRQQLADYLSVERSALSSELSKMRRDGLLTYKKNHFELLPEGVRIERTPV